MLQRAGFTTSRPLPSVARFPAVPAAICFLGGIGLYAKLPAVVLVWLAALVVSTLLAVLLRRRAVLATLSLCLGWLTAGVLAAQLAVFQYPADHIGLYAADDSRLAQLELSLDDP